MTDIRKRLRLTKGENEFYGRRPDVQVQLDKEPLHNGCDVCLQISAEWGQPLRWVELTSSEARELATYLNEIASLADQSETEAA